MEFLENLKTKIGNLVSSEVKGKIFFERLFEEDKKNVDLILESLKNPDSQEQVGGVIVAIGSVLRNKKDPEDIDLRIFAKRGASIKQIIQHFREAVEKTRNFKISEGKVPTEKADEQRDCLYLKPPLGKTIHVILPSQELDAPFDDEMWFNNLFRRKYSILLEF